MEAQYRKSPVTSLQTFRVATPFAARSTNTAEGLERWSPVICRPKTKPMRLGLVSFVCITNKLLIVRPVAPTYRFSVEHSFRRALHRFMP